MTTQRQIAANRKNAQRSTGPRTPRGKAVSSRNNTQHGLYSTAPVIPRLESPQAWAAHHATTLEALAPDDPLEHTLAERIALILWRSAASTLRAHRHHPRPAAGRRRSRRRARRSRHRHPGHPQPLRRSAVAACAPSTDYIRLHWEAPMTGAEPTDHRGRLRADSTASTSPPSACPASSNQGQTASKTSQLDRRPSPADIIAPSPMPQTSPRRSRPSAHAAMPGEIASSNRRHLLRDHSPGADPPQQAHRSPGHSPRRHHPLRDPPHPPAQPDPQAAPAAPAPALHRPSHRAAILRF